MNNACPGCGAVYAVTSKDVGRKLKCKKCSMALVVTDDGLVADTPAVAVPATPADEFDTGDEVGVGTKKKARRYSTGGAGLGEMIAKVGGIPTILFSVGVFLVLWFTFMDPISEAAVARAQLAEKKIRLEQQAELKKLLPKGKTNPMELEGDEKKNFEEKAKKINEDYNKRAEEAKDDAAMTSVDVIRGIRFDKYGQMFGFIFLAFGCIGYLRTEQPLVMRIVAATVLSLMLLMVFSLATGGCGGTKSSGPIMKMGKE